MVDARLLCVALVAVATARPAAAAVDGEGVDKAVEAARVTTAPTIDGVLDDVAWQAAVADDRFTQSFPDEGVAPTERTEVRVVYDDDAVYVGLRMHDDTPDQIVRSLARRDREVEGDWVSIVIDSRHDHATALFFRMTAAGVQVDGQYVDDITASNDWDGVWEGEVSVDGNGWAAELKIPLSTLRFSSDDEHEWGFQVVRYLSRRKETALWTFSPRTVRGFVSRAGHLRGLARLAPQRVFELRPFVVARGQSGVAAGGGLAMAPGGLEGAIDAGLDLKVGLTSDLVLDATVRPDFGQIEADQVVLNLTRFETFVPEKRPFFVEGVDVFRTPLPMFYSRRIGRSLNELEPGAPIAVGMDVAEVGEVVEPARLQTATKLVGELTPSWSIGLLTAFTGGESITTVGETPARVEVAPPIGIAVARARWSPGGASSLGVTATSASRLGGAVYRAAADHDAYTSGVDGQWQSDDGIWRVTGHAVMSQWVDGSSHEGELGQRCEAGTPGCRPIARADGTVIAPGDLGFGGTLVAERAAEHWTVHADYTGLSSHLDLNDVGFLTEFGQHTVSAGGGYRDTDASGPLRSYESDAGGVLITTTDGAVIKQAIGLNLAGQYRGFVDHALNLGTTFGRMWDPYETGDGARLEVTPGATLRSSVGTDARHAASLRGNVYLYRDYVTTLHRAEGDLELTLRGGERVMVQLGTGATWHANAVRAQACVDGDGGPCQASSAARTYRFAELDAASLSLTGRVNLALSPRLALDGYAQLFLSRGEFSRPTQIATGARPSIHLAELVPVMDEAAGHFRDATLNANLVLRWDARDGTTIMAAFTRSQRSLANDTAAPELSLAGLTDGGVDNLLLVKVAFFRP